MMRGVYAVFGLLALTLVWLMAMTVPSAARSVFVLYDTSGSMEDRRFLPAFGAAMLGTTLDGRAGKDRLFTMSFADYRTALDTIGQGDAVELTADNVQQFATQLRRPAYRTEAMTSNTVQSRTTDGMNSRFSSAAKGTPYGAIEIMLDAIARETTVGEDVHFVIVSDGEFQAEPSPKDVLQSIRTHRDRIKADVEVSFLLILPARPDDAPRAKDLRENVAKQNIRASLLEVFNGDPDLGSYEVDSGLALWTALQEIIAKIAATDRTELSRYVRHQGQDVLIDTPFSITRIVSVATAADGPPPNILGASFSGEPEVIASKMRGSDPEFPGIAFQGLTSQFRFVPGLPPGLHSLHFDRAVDTNVFLLFDTNVIASLDIIDTTTGQPAPRDAQGQATLELGRSYQIQTSLSDPGSAAYTNFEKLSQTTAFTAEIDGPGGLRALALQRDDTANYAVATFTADQTGTYTASSQVRIPGFVSPKSTPLAFVILDRAITLALDAERPAESCAACAPGQIGSTVVIGESETDVSRFEISVSGEVPGTVRFDQMPASDLIRLLDASGAELLPGAEIAAIPGQPILLLARRKGIDANKLSTARGTSFGFTLTPALPSQGNVLEVRRTLLLTLPEARISLQSYAKGSPADGPLALIDDELLSGAIRADLRIEETLVVPTLAMFTGEPTSRSWLWSVHLTYDDYIISIAPKANIFALVWLETSAWVSGREVEALVSYADTQGLQRAAAPVRMTFTIGWRAYVLSLALNMLAIVTIIYLLWAFLALFWVQRFPVHAVAERRFPMDEFVRKQPLRGSWLIYLGVLLAPFRGAPREKTVIMGLHLASIQGGAQILLPKTGTPRWYVASRGQTIAEIRNLTPSIKTVTLRWGDRLEDEQEREQSITLVRDRRVAR